MPELPEVERLRRSLEPHILGKRVASARLRRRDICESFAGEPPTITPVRTAPERLLLGSTITGTLRRGKQLALFADTGRILCVHLGMSGQLLFRPGPPTRPLPTHVHALWTLTSADGSIHGTLLFRDPRRFGGLWTFDSLAALRHARWNRLGPDALLVWPRALRKAFAGSRRAVKAALLNQSVVAGVGNIYADEALFKARIHPARDAANITEQECANLAGAIRRTLRRAIQSGGSTIRDYRDADGNAGTASLHHAVYGRSGQPCRVCRHRLSSGLLAQRTTVWCPVCQPLEPAHHRHSR